MKRIYQWSDSQHNISNTIYKCENGIKVLHSKNPASKDIFFSVVVRAGSSFESLVGVPGGTAHFLEHMLRNPNNVFTTQKQIDAYEYGNTRRPRLMTNAGTSKKYVYVYGYANTKGTHRLLKRIYSELGYPVEMFEKYIDKERKIILAESAEDLRPEKDPEYQYEQFMVGEELPNLAARIIGEREEILKIDPEVLQHFHRKTFIGQNIVFSVQSAIGLTPAVQRKIEVMSQCFEMGQRRVRPLPETLRNRYKVGFFQDKREQGTFISFNFFRKVTRRVNYKEKVLFMLLADLLYKLGYDELREKKGLVYGFQTFRFSRLAFQNDISGFKCSTDNENFEKLLEGIHELIHQQLIEFLSSGEGQKWFDHSVSRYIYPNTSPYEAEYAEMRSIDVLEGNEPYVPDRTIAVAKRMTRKDLCEYVASEIHDVSPHVWIVSPMERDSVMKTVKNSSLAVSWK